jgi:nucleoside-diphosphate-sugar epimerase
MLYVEDLAEAVKKWLSHGNTSHCTFEVHDGQLNGYGWENLISAMARLRGRPLHRLPIPASLLKFMAVLNVIIARVAGYDPMLSPGKVREIGHPNWVCDNALLSRETGWTPRVCLEEGLRLTLTSDTKTLAARYH